MSDSKILTSDEIKKSLNSILVDFAIFCEEYDLKYYLLGGTFLGAVRHKGFIPWDDDIDIGMPRNEYERMLDILENENIKENYVVQSLRFKNTGYPFTKIVDKNFKIIESRSKLRDYLWIDIFPLDGVTEKEYPNVLLLSKYTSVLTRLLGFSSNKIEYRGPIKTTVTIVSKIFPTRVYTNLLDKFAKRHKIEDCKYVANISWGFIYQTFPAELFDDVEMYEFEGRMYPGVKDYDTMLKICYGDTYMQLPPEEERDTHNIKVVRNEVLK